MILIGSRALAYYIEDIVVNDTDLVCSYDEAVAYGKKIKAKSFFPINGGKTIFMKDVAGNITEAEITWEGSRAAKLHAFVSESDAHMGGEFDGVHGWFVPSINFLYMLKMSHRYLKNSPHFLKTMADIRMLRGHGCAIPPRLKDFYEERMRDTYTYSLPKLNVSKDAFFDSTDTGVPQKYDHDSIHEAVKLQKQPAYTYFQDAIVMCSKVKFQESSWEIQRNAVIEESCVLALERSLIPFPGGMTPEQAWKFALMKVCTSITSGWFREFAWEHYDEVVAMMEKDLGYGQYVEAFNRGVESGVVELKEKQNE